MSTKFQKAAPSHCGDMLFLVRYELSKHCRSEFLSVFFHCFFILLYYTYETRVQNFERLRPVIVEIYYFWYDMNCPDTAGVSFCLFFLILFSFCSIIATKHVYKISKGCTQSLWRYVIFGRK